MNALPLPHTYESSQTQAAAPTAATEMFTLRHTLIDHPSFVLARDEVARIHRRGRQAGVAEGLMLVGQTGSGKSTLLRSYAERHPRTLVDGIARIPVLMLQVPEYPTVRSLGEAVLEAMGDRAAARGSAAEKFERIIRLCHRCCVELILIDEFQHFTDTRNGAEVRRATDWLKLLITRLRIPVVLAGLPRSILAINANPQLRRRFAAPYYLEPFSIAVPGAQAEFRGVLKAFERALPPGSLCISGHEVAQRVYYSTNGLIDYVVKLLDDAVSRGGTGPGGGITLTDLAAAFRRAVWRNAPDRLNPFVSKAKLRLLTKRGEPFDIWDDITKYLGHGGRHEHG